MDELQAGHRLGAYRIRRVAGRGAVGIVYLAEHESQGKPVAIKTLSPALARESVFRERFSREAQGAAAVEHPNIISVFDVGEHNGTPFLVMTYVDGPDLERVLNDRGGKLEKAEAVLICTSIAEALDAAAAQGLAHRDVKPANILLEGWGTGPGAGNRQPHVYLTDFGLIKSSAQARVTQTGQFVGTLLYMAPEQIESRAVPASDQYSLACVLWECLTGTYPFEPTGGSTFSLLTAHISQPVPRVSERPGHWSSELDEVFLRALAKDPARRYPTCTAFMDGATRALGLGGAAPRVTPEPPKTAIEHTQIIPVSPRLPTSARPSAPPSAPAPTPPPVPVRTGPDPAASLAGTPAAFPEMLGRGGPTGFGGPPSQPSATPPSRRGFAIGAAVLVVLVLAALAALVVFSGGDGQSAGGETAGDGDPTTTPVAQDDDGAAQGGDGLGDQGGEQVPTIIEQGRIAFVGDGEVWAARADGSGAVDLTQGRFPRPLQPAWRPGTDQGEVAISTADGLRLLDANRGQVVALTEVGEDADPAWSPDGQLLVFSSPAEGGRDLVVLDVAEGSTRSLGVEQSLGAAGPVSAFRPAWSPDGTTIAFQAEVDGDLLVARIPADGGAPSPYAGDPAARDFHPAWTPGGDLLFTSDRTGREQIWLRDAVTGEERQVTDVEGDAFDADPSPCGDWIAFRITVGDAPRIGYQAIDGGDVQAVPVPDGVTEASDPSWAGPTCPA